MSPFFILINNRLGCLPFCFQDGLSSLVYLQPIKFEYNDILYSRSHKGKSL
nr:MAG TPA: hypothetical protein [Caudoviricetes sp.]